MKIISRNDAISTGLNKYFTGIPCRNGHVSERYSCNTKCVKCVSDQSKLRYDNNQEEMRNRRKKYYYENQDKEKLARDRYNKEHKDEIKAKRKDNYHKNRSREIEKTKQWRMLNKEKVREYQKKYREENKEYYRNWRLENKDKSNEYSKNWRERNPEKSKQTYKMSAKRNPIPKFLRNSLKRILNNWKGGRSDMEIIHGYTYENLISRIEFQFKDGMSWDNRSEWHIDHKKPISRFLEQGITDPRIINALSNLQPMWASDNMSKSSKFK